MMTLTTTATPLTGEGGRGFWTGSCCAWLGWLADGRQVHMCACACVCVWDGQLHPAVTADAAVISLQVAALTDRGLQPHTLSNVWSERNF